MVKIGDKIKITDAFMTDNLYKNGDILTVAEVRHDGSVRVKFGEHLKTISKAEFEIIETTTVKVGDKIKIIAACRTGGLYNNGDILTVHELLCDGAVRVQFPPNRLHTILESEFEVLPDTTIKVGDMIQIVQLAFAGECYKIGEIYEVIEVPTADGCGPNGVYIRTPNHTNVHRENISFLYTREYKKLLDATEIKEKKVVIKAGDWVKIIAPYMAGDYYKLGRVYQVKKVIAEGAYLDTGSHYSNDAEKGSFALSKEYELYRVAGNYTDIPSATDPTPDSRELKVGQVVEVLSYAEMLKNPEIEFVRNSGDRTQVRDKYNSFIPKMEATIGKQYKVTRVSSNGCQASLEGLGEQYTKNMVKIISQPPVPIRKWTKEEIDYAIADCAYIFSNCGVLRAISVTSYERGNNEQLNDADRENRGKPRVVALLLDYYNPQDIRLLKQEAGFMPENTEWNESICTMIALRKLRDKTLPVWL